MTPALLSRMGRALYGDQWQRALSRAIGKNERTIRRWAAGDYPVPDGDAELIRHEMRRRRREIDELLTA